MASEREIDDVIKTLIAEGIGEGEEGMRRIAETIITRGQQRGLTPAEVVRERAQYTGYSNPGPAALRAQADPNALSAAQAAWQLAQGPDDPTGGANHYFNPNIVRPSWAQSMTPTGEYGGHAFYTDRPVQRRAPVAPNPVSQAPLMAASRALTSPSGGNSDLASALQGYATREGNRVTPASAEDRVTARNRQFFAPDPFNGDPLTPATGGVVGTIPSRPNPSDAARRAALSIGANQTYAGQERMPALAAAAIGGPPTTRSVPTTTVRFGNVSTNVNDQRGEQLATRAPARQAIAAIAQDATKATLAPLLSQAQKLAIMGTAQREDRLPSEPMLGARALPPIAQPGTESVATLLDTVNPQGLRTTAPAPMQQAAIAPIPAQRSAAPLMMASAQTQRSIAPRQAAPLMAASRQPLSILVQGSNTVQPAQFRGSATGMPYSEGQVFLTANGPVSVNGSGGFVNQESGRVSGHTEQGGYRYDPDTARHEYVGKR